MENSKMTQVVIERVNKMLKDEKINAVYQSFKTESEGQDWILKAAIATLIVPVEQRKTA